MRVPRPTKIRDRAIRCIPMQEIRRNPTRARRSLHASDLRQTAIIATSETTANVAADIAIRTRKRVAAARPKPAVSIPIVAPARIAEASATHVAQILDHPVTARPRINVARVKVAEAFSSATAGADSLLKITRAASKHPAAARLPINAAPAAEAAEAACNVTKARVVTRRASRARKTKSAATARARRACAIDLARKFFPSAGKFSRLALLKGVMKGPESGHFSVAHALLDRRRHESRRRLSAVLRFCSSSSAGAIG